MNLARSAEDFFSTCKKTLHFGGGSGGSRPPKRRGEGGLGKESGSPSSLLPLLIPPSPLPSPTSVAPPELQKAEGWLSPVGFLWRGCSPRHSLRPLSRKRSFLTALLEVGRSVVGSLGGGARQCPEVARPGVCLEAWGHWQRGHRWVSVSVLA